MSDNKTLRQVKRRLMALYARIDQFSRRDRLSLACGLLAAVIGIEMMVVQPLRTQRLIITQSILAENNAQSEAEKAARIERAARLADMKTRVSLLEARLAALGLKEAHRDPLTSFLNQAALRHGLVVASARGLPVEELNLTPNTLTPETATAGEAAVVATPPTLYRHRAEVKLQGPVGGLAQALAALERDMAPLRIERVQFTPGGGAVQATVVLTTISQERAWLVF
jgi:hypothetical protein